MAFDPNDRESVKQFLIRARNEGYSDDEAVEFVKKRRLSSAGKTLQKESAFKIQQSRPILSAGAADVLPPGKYQEALPYMFNAPGQALKEGIDYLAAEKPEDRPTALGAAARITAVGLAPKFVGAGAKLIGRSVGFAGPAMERVAQSGPIQAIKTMYGKMAQGAEEQLGTTIATKTGEKLAQQQGSALAKDAFVDNLNNAGKTVKVEKLAQSLMDAIPEAETFGSDVMKQARERLVQLGDELLSKRQNGAVGIGDFMTFKENLGQQLFKVSNGRLRQKLGAMVAEANDTLIQDLGPAAANHIRTLETATANRLGVLRKVNKLFKTNPEKVIQKAAGSEKIMRAINELDGQFGTNFAEEIGALAAKKAFTPHDMPFVYRALDRITRIAGSSAVGFAEGGPAGLLTYLASSPPMRRQAAKLGLLLSTTALPQVGAAAGANAVSPSPEPQGE